MSEKIATSNAIAIEGTYNFRDLGGLPLIGGGFTAHDVLYRSDALSGLTKQGEQQLADTSVGTIIDFRTAHERQTASNRIPGMRHFNSLHQSVLAGSMADLARNLIGGNTPNQAELKQAMAAVPTLKELYFSVLEGGTEPFAVVARHIAASHDESPSAVLVHCTAGKDRTGVSTAVILDAVGVTREAIIENYAQSQQHLAGAWAENMLRSVAALGITVTPAIRTLLCDSPPEAIQQTLNWLDENGGSSAYLAAGGLTDAELNALRERFTQ